MLSNAKHLPHGVRGRPFAGAQGDTALLHGRIHDVCGFHRGISLDEFTLGDDEQELYIAPGQVR